jgi:predicted SAM-dependent methyltransferase
MIKIDLDDFIKNNRVILDLGCGPNKAPGRLGIDMLDFPCVDIVADLNKGFEFLPDSSVDEIHSRSLFEHIDDLGSFMTEIVRILKADGKCYLFVPHFSNPYYYSDYTHKSFIGLYTFYYFVDEDQQLTRKVPNFYTDTRIIIESTRLEFYTAFGFLRLVKKVIGKLVNLSDFTKAFYEENLCYLFPCYGLTIVFSPQKKAK